jgi:hypothetical protein
MSRLTLVVIDRRLIASIAGHVTLTAIADLIAATP